MILFLIYKTNNDDLRIYDLAPTHQQKGVEYWSEIQDYTNNWITTEKGIKSKPPRPVIIHKWLINRKSRQCQWINHSPWWQLLHSISLISWQRKERNSGSKSSSHVQTSTRLEIHGQNSENDTSSILDIKTIDLLYNSALTKYRKRLPK